MKTRLQLSSSQQTPLSVSPSLSSQVRKAATPRFTSSLDCIRHILKNEGVPGLYRGLSASYLGVTEGTIQWVLYERLKKLSGGDGKGRGSNGEKIGLFRQWLSMMGAAGTAKMAASLVTYPHEVRFLLGL